MFRTLALIAAAALMAGCAAQTVPKPKPLAGDDPANPQAPEAPVSSILAPLALEPPPTDVASDTGTPPPAAGRSMQHMDMKGMDMDGMDMSQMPGMHHGQRPPATQPDEPAPGMTEMHHHSHPQPATQPEATHALYTCTMHPQVVSEIPGNCPICGMKLVRKEGGQ
jgi:hypothetical protein